VSASDCVARDRLAGTAPREEAGAKKCTAGKAGTVARLKKGGYQNHVVVWWLGISRWTKDCGTKRRFIEVVFFGGGRIHARVFGAFGWKGGAARLKKRRG